MAGLEQIVHAITPNCDDDGIIRTIAKVSSGAGA
jgi:hypothetical protein